VGIEELNPDPSFGSHFFQNVTSLRIGYFTIQKNERISNLDMDWLDEQPVKQTSKYVRWIELESPLHIHINGSSGEGVIMKPQGLVKEVMDEEESTGI
jgi:hypothetical protein